MAEHKGFQELVADAKKKITEISPTDAASKAKSSCDAMIVDVREKMNSTNRTYPTRST
ncbi:MAG TPA: hypothetical protein VN942_03425 [Chthoniobacterales bacterium]|nr:hypothetical protein [Chthoniobacterales bacterium]